MNLSEKYQKAHNKSKKLLNYLKNYTNNIRPFVKLSKRS